MAATVLAAYAYIGFEWLFFVTKPSLLQFEPVASRLQVLASAPLPLILAGVALGGVPIALLAMAKRPRVRTLLAGGAALPAAFLLAGTILLLVENFTYTLFGFTVVSQRGFWRIAYGAAFAALGFRALRVLVRWILGGAAGRPTSVAPALAGALALVALAGAAVGRSAATDPADRPATPPVRTPDIYLIGIDGVETSHLSGFGYSRPTTPFLDRWMQDALVFENALSNGGQTTSAVGALLTGRLPTRTHMIYRPDVFLGSAAYRHLPAMLRASGYRSIGLGMRYYLDPFDWNMLGGFDQALGGRTDGPRSALGSRRLTALVGENSALFVRETGERLLSRAGHVFGIVRGENWIEGVRDTRGANIFTDADRMSQLFGFVERERAPVFAHVHFMVTHAEVPHARQRVFATAETIHKSWNDDDYDDAIREFDDDFRQLVEWLRATGRYARALVIVYSDHGRRWQATERVPLMIRFPGDAPRGRRSDDAQLVDVAPTVLDYLGLPTPPWMDGRSLLDPPVPGGRPIFFIERRRGELGADGTERLELKPPFFTLGEVGLARCDSWYSLNVYSGELKRSRIGGHTRPCTAPAPPEAEVRAALLEHLRQSGYDVSGIPEGRGAAGKRRRARLPPSPNG